MKLSGTIVDKHAPLYVRKLRLTRFSGLHSFQGYTVSALHSFEKRVQLDGLREMLVYFDALLRAFTRF